MIISLFETVRLSVSISPRNLYNSLKSIKEKPFLFSNMAIKAAKPENKRAFFNVRECSDYCGDNAVLNCRQPPGRNLHLILREKGKLAVASPKKWKFDRVDNISAERVQAAGSDRIAQSVARLT